MHQKSSSTVQGRGTPPGRCDGDTPIGIKRTREIRQHQAEATTRARLTTTTLGPTPEQERGEAAETSGSTRGAAPAGAGRERQGCTPAGGTKRKPGGTTREPPGVHRAPPEERGAGAAHYLEWQAIQATGTNCTDEIYIYIYIYRYCLQRCSAQRRIQHS